MLIKVLKRAKELSQYGVHLHASASLSLFLKNNFTLNNFRENKTLLDAFSRLDDHDVLAALKEWQFNEDEILAILSNKIIKRKLLKIEITDTAVSKEKLLEMKQLATRHYGVDMKLADYLVFEDCISNNAYTANKSNINILYKDGSLKDIAEASDQLNISALSKVVTKHFVCYPKECKL